MVGAAVKAFSLLPSSEPRWVFAGTTHLDPGAYVAQFLLPVGCTLSQVEIAPPCLNPIEPAGGWMPTGVTTAEDLAVTAVKAIDAEHELPPAATPIEIAGDRFQVDAPPDAVEERARASGLEAMKLRGGHDGLRAVVAFELPEAGLYSVTAFLTPGAGQRWLADGCRKAIVCPEPRSGWRPVMSQAFAAGRHTLVLTLGEGASLELIRIEKKKGEPSDYVATLKRLGFDPGPDGPVSRARALDAMRFIREQHSRRVSELCGDVPKEPPTALPTQAAGASPIAQPPRQPPGRAAPAPIGQTPPVLPPQQPGSPTQPSGGGL